MKQFTRDRRIALAIAAASPPRKKTRKATGRVGLEIDNTIEMPSPSQNHQIDMALVKSALPLVSTLKQRHFDVLVSCGQGCANKEIAALRGMSSTSVDSAIVAINKKLGLQDIPNNVLKRQTAQQIIRQFFADRRT